MNMKQHVRIRFHMTHATQSTGGIGRLLISRTVCGRKGNVQRHEDERGERHEDDEDVPALIGRPAPRVGRQRRLAGRQVLYPAEHTTL